MRSIIIQWNLDSTSLNVSPSWVVSSLGDLQDKYLIFLNLFILSINGDHY
jgi:hypothetical protein